MVPLKVITDSSNDGIMSMVLKWLLIDPASSMTVPKRVYFHFNFLLNSLKEESISTL